MELIIALIIAVPLGSSALLVAIERLLPAWLRNGLALGAALSVTVLAGILLQHSSIQPIVTWFGGWRPKDGIAIGVDYVVEPLGAGLATLTGLLTTVALLYSRQFFGEISSRYQALVLVFAASSIDFAFSGDLFNMFVAFELVAVCAFVLTGFYAEKEAPLQGAINFAITNTIGGLVVLLGLVFLYGRTGTLNLAEMGAVLAGHRPNGVVIVAFALLTAGFLTKAAVVPFHFWLPDAYGTAPVPACVLFAGVMSELGLFGLVRVWETVFSGVVSSPAEHHLQVLFCAMGILTALVGTAMALVQNLLRRLLGFVTIAHMGLYLVGFGLLRSDSLGAIGVLVLGDGLVKAALFLSAGVLQHPHRRRDQSRGMLVLAATAAMIIGALALADLPPFASSVGKDALVAAAGQGGWWVELVVALTVVGSSAAVLKTVAGISSGGEVAPPVEEQDQWSADADEDEFAIPGSALGIAHLIGPPVILLCLALGIGLTPHLDQRAVRAAVRFSDRTAYERLVLYSQPSTMRSSTVISRSALTVDLLEVGGTVALAAILVFNRRLTRIRAAASFAVGWLRDLHSGHVGDQVTWQILGIAALAGLGGLVFR